MKKVINGRLYDTDKARRIGYDDGGTDSMTVWSETLYQKRTGEYFIHGEGGAMTKYAASTEYGNWRSGQKIIPLTAATAREWAEEHLTADAYANIFGLPDEGESVEALNVQIDAALMARIRAKAADAGISIRECVETALKNNV